MRTDSLRVSSEFQRAALDYIKEHFGENTYRDARVYKSKATAQDAHEAIRPTNTTLEPSKIRKYLTATNINFISSYGIALWQTRWCQQSLTQCLRQSALENIFRDGSTLKFAGFLVLYEESTDDAKWHLIRPRHSPRTAENEN